MREFLKLDVVMQKISKLIKTGNKAKKVISAVVFSWTVFNVIAAMWALIPKFEKLKEVDGQELIDALTTETENEAEIIPEAVTAE